MGYLASSKPGILKEEQDYKWQSRIDTLNFRYVASLSYTLYNSVQWRPHVYQWLFMVFVILATRFRCAGIQCGNYSCILWHHCIELYEPGRACFTPLETTRFAGENVLVWLQSIKVSAALSVSVGAYCLHKMMFIISSCYQGIFLNFLDGPHLLKSKWSMCVTYFSNRKWETFPND